MAFDGNGAYNLDGRSDTFTENEITLGHLEENGTVITDKINSSTVRELMDAKVISELTFSNSEVYAWTFEEFMAHVATIL